MNYRGELRSTLNSIHPLDTPSQQWAVERLWHLLNLLRFGVERPEPWRMPCATPEQRPQSCVLGLAQ
jgi:hypothetical protein